MADDFVSTHKCSFEDVCSGGDGKRRVSNYGNSSFQHCVVIMVGECVTIVKARAIGRINVLFWSLEISGNFSYLFLPCLVSGQRPVCVDLGSGNDGA